MRNWLIWKIFAAYNIWSKWRLHNTLPGIREEMAEYALRSKSTGVKFTTLWRAVRLILRYKPEIILECGTGLSTIVLAAAIKKLREQSATYAGKIVSLESVDEWFAEAKKNLPDKYQDIVELVLGAREKYEFLFFRGYCHSNIPVYDYDFVFLDGPSYQDQHGGAFCADVFQAMTISSAPKLRGVIDTRVSSVFVMQQVFGVGAARYYPIARTADFLVSKQNFRVRISSRDFSSDHRGRLTLTLSPETE